MILRWIAVLLVRRPFQLAVTIGVVALLAGCCVVEWVMVTEVETK